MSAITCFAITCLVTLHHTDAEIPRPYAQHPLYISVPLEGTSGKHQAVMCMGVCMGICACMHAEVRGQPEVSSLRSRSLAVVECVLLLAGWIDHVWLLM